MKRIYSFIIMVALLITAFAISGCFPPNYSKEQAKKIVSEHKHEAFAWFSKNMPAAKPDSECEAYVTGLDLFGAIKGSYKVNGKSYDFVFDYNTKNFQNPVFLSIFYILNLLFSVHSDYIKKRKLSFPI